MARQRILGVGLLLCCYSSLAVSAPYEDQSDQPELAAKASKDMSSVMQTLLTDIAKELFSRSTSNSQVMTLNFTNLLILLVLKGVLWGAGYVGQGGLKGRSADIPEESLMTETEILLLLSYLMGDEEKNFECLQRVACEDPEKAKDYISAATIIMNASKFIGIESSNNEKYQDLLEKLEEAVRHKEEGGECEVKYSCLRNQTENNVKSNLI